MTLIYFVKCFTSMGICWGIYKVALADKKSFLFNRGFLLCSIVGLSITPFITLPSFASRALVPMLPPLEGVIPSNDHLSAQSSNIGIPVIEPSETLILFDWSWIFYCIGFVILVRILFNIAKLAWSSYKDFLYLQDGVRIIKSNYKKTPFSFFNNLFVSPRDIELGLPDEIWEHENCHIRHHHSLDRILVELVLIVQWWNPFAHFLIKALKENHEFMADDFAMRELHNKKIFLDRLVSYKAKSGPHNIFQLGFAQGSLIKRIRMIQASKNPTSFIRRVLIACIFSLITISCSDSSGEYFIEEEDIDLGIVKGHLNDYEYIYPASLIEQVEDPHLMLTGLPEYRQPSKMLFSNFMMKQHFIIMLDGKEISRDQLELIGYNKIKSYQVYDISHQDAQFKFRAELYTQSGYFEFMETWLDLTMKSIENLKKEIRTLSSEDPLDAALRKYNTQGDISNLEIPNKKKLSQDRFEDLLNTSKYRVSIDYIEVPNQDLSNISREDFSYYIVDQISVGRRVNINLITNETFNAYIERIKQAPKKRVNEKWFGDF